MYTSLLLSLSATAFAQSWGHGWGGGHGNGGGWGHGNGNGNGNGWSGRGGWWHIPPGDEPAPPTSGNTTFTQPIDHNNPSLGTFEQLYMYDTTYWKPGGPVVLFTPGEVNASAYGSYLTNKTSTGVVAEKIGAATIVIEHRYWGYSSPYSELTTANLTYLTLDQAIHDFTNFANNAKLPFAPHGGSNAKDVPWVWIGGSYSGALSAWIESVDPGTMWAYWASSAPVEAISDYWEYFYPVQEGMPKNCSTDVNLVIEHMDNILTTGSDAEIADLKKMFMLENVTHNDDFMAALENGPWLWQGNQFYRTTGFYDWCDSIEGVYNTTNATLPSASGVGLDKALQGYANWFTQIFLPGYCESFGYEAFNGTYNTYCFDTYDPTSPFFTDTSLSNQIDRQWQWMLCNEPFGYWQDGAPEGRSTLVSRLVTAEYWIRQCPLFFPTGPNGATFGIAEGKTEAGVNAYTGGWNIDNSTRLLYVNGGYDPWREAGVSSDFRPGGMLQSTEQVPVHFVPGGFHTSDLITKNGQVNASCGAVIASNVQQMVEWVNEWPKHGGGHGWKRWEA